MLSGLGVDYEVKTLPDIDESYPPTLVGAEIPVFISQQKANAYKSLMQPNDLIMTADTNEWLNGKVYGKPRDEADAVQMIAALAGNTHQVFTGVTLLTAQGQQSFSDVTDVTFAPLTEEEIRFYVAHYRPFDKAGSYGVQEWIGYVADSAIPGSFYNVMGLPVSRLYDALKAL